MKEFSAIEEEGERAVAEHLKAQGFFENEKEAIERERVLGILNNLVSKFVYEIAQKENILLEKKNASKIFTFGSYRLGVHASGADIDALCVVPNFVGRSEFFSKFYEDLSREKCISGLTKVANTFVPLIKFKIYSIPIDLVFARLDLPSIPQNIDLLDDKLLKHMDEKCILSLNGNRVTDEVLKSVPNVETFHKALRFVKYWGQTRCVYGHSYGYFGGIAYAICVAKICQMYPSLGPFQTIAKFFHVFAKWPWPQPVIIKEVEDCNYNLKVWNPKANPAHKSDKMPVITPAYPSICSTHNITLSTLTAIKRELTRAVGIFEKIGKDEITVENGIKTLCEPSDFFSRHKNYIAVAMAGDQSKEFHRFLGYAESRMRMLALKIEALENVAYSYVFPKKYVLEETTPKDNPILAKMKGKEGVYTFCVVFIGVEFSSAKLPIDTPRKMNLSRPVSEFKAMLEQYEQEEESEILYEVIPAKQKNAEEMLKVLSDKKRKRKTEEANEEVKKR